MVLAGSTCVGWGGGDTVVNGAGAFARVAISSLGGLGRKMHLCLLEAKNNNNEGEWDALGVFWGRRWLSWCLVRQDLRWGRRVGEMPCPTVQKLLVVVSTIKMGHNWQKEGVDSVGSRRGCVGEWWSLG